MEPNTPAPTLKVGETEYPLAWTKRSEAVISRYGYDVLAIVEGLRKRQTFLYALCVGLKAALPPQQAPEQPEDLADWVPEPADQTAAAKSLLTIITHAYPKPAQKKSASKP